MTPDLPDFDFSGLDADRPLRPEQTARLQAALLAAAAAAPAEMSATAAAPGEAVTLDSPRPIPPEVRERVEGALLAAAGASAGPSLPQQPAHMAGSSGNLTGAAGNLAERRRRKAWAPALAAAAVVALLLGVVATMGRDNSHSPDQTALPARGGPTSTTLADEASVPSAEAAAPTVSAPAAPPTTVAPTAPRRTAAPAPKAAAAAPKAAPPAAAPGASSSDPSPTAAAAPAGRPSTAPSSSPAAGSAPSAAGQGSADPGPPPPFAYSGSGSRSSADSQAGVAPSPSPAPSQPGPPAPDRSEPPAGKGAPNESAAAPAPSGPPLRVAVVGGDPAQEAAFNAYVQLVNQSGGVRQRPLEVVAATPGRPTDGAVATVNLSGRALATPDGAPAWTGGTLLETLDATEDLLRGDRVFSFAGVPERQAHLAAAAVFPQQSPGATAVVYTGPGAPWDRAVPDAFRDALARRGVEVSVLPYDADRPPSLFRPADAAFLALSTDDARSFLRQATVTGYRPARGLAGVGSLFDEALLPDLPAGTTVVSPYTVPDGAEGDSIRQAAGGQASARALHGWASAKYLAVALWQSGADTPAAVAGALTNLTGYDAGLAPPYETRPGTRSRTPEGVVFQAGAGGFTAQGEFRRDPD